MPTDEQIREYAQRLPEVYQAVLKAFVEPGKKRRTGDGITVESIAEALSESYEHYRAGDEFDAVTKLIGRGILIDPPDTENASWESISIYTPTQLGEKLISVLTGSLPVPAKLPDVPELTWA